MHFLEDDFSCVLLPVLMTDGCNVSQYFFVVVYDGLTFVALFISNLRLSFLSFLEFCDFPCSYLYQCFGYHFQMGFNFIFHVYFSLSCIFGVYSVCFFGLYSLFLFILVDLFNIFKIIVIFAVPYPSISILPRVLICQPIWIVLFIGYEYQILGLNV